MCASRLHRPLESTAENTRGYSLLAPDKAHVLSYLEVLFGSQAVATVTMFCSAANQPAEREFVAAIAQHLKRYGYLQLLATADPDQVQTLLGLGFQGDASGLVYSGAPALVSPSVPTLSLADGSKVLRARVDRLAGYECRNFSGDQGTFAYVHLDAAGRTTGYFETDDQNVVVGLCGDFARLFVVIKQVFLQRGLKSLLVSSGLAAPALMTDLGFTLQDGLYKLRLTQRYVTTEREHAQEYVREIYEQLCRLEEDGRKHLEQLVQVAPEAQLVKLLQARGVRGPSDTRELVLGLLESEARAFCGNKTEFALGVAVMQLGTNEADESRWGVLKRGLVKYAKKMIQYLWDGLKWAVNKVSSLGKGTLKILSQVFTMCTSTAISAGACATSIAWMCSYVNAMVMDMKAAVIAASAVSFEATALSYAISALSMLCSYFPSQQTKKSQEAVTDAVARLQKGEKLTDEAKALLKDELKTEDTSWWTYLRVGASAASNIDQAVHDSCLASTSHPPFVEDMDECKARLYKQGIGL